MRSSFRSPALATAILAVCAAILIALTVCSPSSGQTQGDTVSTPIPGAGHDYLHLLDEIVNPANGSLSIRIRLPIPQSRGTTLPFAFTYDSNRVYSLRSDTFDWAWVSGGDNLGQGGWSFSVPELSYTPGNPSSTNPDGTTNFCDTASDFIFRDSAGVSHQLGLFLTS